MKRMNRKIQLLICCLLCLCCMSGCNYQEIKEPETTSEETAQLQTDIPTTEGTKPTEELVYYTALFPVCIEGKYEYIDTEGNVVTNGQYDYADFFYDGMGIVKKDGRIGAVDLSGKLAVPLDNYELSRYSDGLAVIEGNKGHYGYVNHLGEIVIPCQYQEAWDFSEGLAIVSSESGYDIINKSGEIRAHIDHRPEIYVSEFHDGYAVIGNAYFDVNGECGIGDNANLPYGYEGWYPSDFSEGFAVQPIKKEFLQNKELEFEEIFNGKNWYHIFIDTEGKNVFEKYFESAYGFSEGYAVVEENGQKGVIDTMGEVVFYDNRLEFRDCKEGCFLFSERVDGVWKFGFLNTEGEVEIPAQYYKVYYNSSCQGFCNGLCLVAEDKEYRHLMYINHKNECVYRYEVPEEH